MRIVVSALFVVAGAGLLAVALPNLAASIVRAPGGQTVSFASAGSPIHPRSFERAADGLHAARGWRDRKDDLADLVIIQENLGRQQVGNFVLRDRLFTEAFANFASSLRHSPVDPSGWLLVAQMHDRLGEREAAAEALRWSLRTSVFRQQHATQRAFLGLGLWDLLDTETRERLAFSIEAAFQRAPENVVAWTVALGLDEEIEAQLAALPKARLAADPAARAAAEANAATFFGPPEPTVAQRFGLAVERQRVQLQAAREEQERVRTMRRALLASSMLITLSLPAPGAAMTIADYIDMRDNGGDVVTEARINDYLVGVLDGLVMLGSVTRETASAPFCMPDEAAVEIDVESFRAELDGLLAQLEDEVTGFTAIARTRTLGLAALQLLTIQHPCAR